MDFLCLNNGECRIPLTEDQIAEVLKAVRPRKRLREVNEDEIFEIAGIKFFKLYDTATGDSFVVSKDVLFRSEFGENNNFSESVILAKLQSEVLPKIIQAIGENNISNFCAKLFALDGSKEYGWIDSTIGIPWLELYQDFNEVFEKHNIDECWWLATPWATPKRGYDKTVLCVTPRGCINRNYCDSGRGVRPFCILSSSIFVSVVNE